MCVFIVAVQLTAKSKAGKKMCHATDMESASLEVTSIID